MLRLRLSNQINAALEFSASDPASLAGGVIRTLERFRRTDVRQLRLVLQVRPVRGAADGWYAPRRGLRDVEVFVDEATIINRPNDDWTDIWEWCVAARAVDHAISDLARDAADGITGEPSRD